MQPKVSKQSGKKYENTSKNETLACKFPGLAIPNDVISEEVDPSVSEVMAELEAFAPVISSKYDFINSINI